AGPTHAAAPDRGHPDRHDRVPPAGGGRRRGRPSERRAQARHGALRPRCAGRAGGDLSDALAIGPGAGILMSIPSLMEAGARAAEGASLVLEDVHHTFFSGTPNEQRALQGVDLVMEERSFVVVVGNNGSGKSTLLNTIAGTVMPDRGRVFIGGKDVT